MSVPQHQKATNLEQAYRNLTPNNPLENDELTLFYQDRSIARQILMKLDLEMSGANDSLPKFLLLGHRGIGKSTELFNIAQQIESDETKKEAYLPIHYSISDLVGAHECDFPQLALSMLLATYNTSQSHGLSLASKHLEKVYSWLATETIETTTSKGALVSLGIPKLLEFIGLKLKAGSDQITKTKRVVQQKMPQLLEILDTLFTDISLKTHKKPVLMLDDIDKIYPVNKGLDLFKNHSQGLAQIPCCVIYTAPVALMLESYYEEILHNSGFHEYYLPMFRIEEPRKLKNPTPKPQVEKLQELVYKRISEDLITQQALNEAIKKTGGVLRHLVKVLQEASMAAMLAEKEQIEQPEVSEALKKQRNEFYRFLEESDYEALLKLEATQERTYVKKEHLHALVALEYSNGQQWFDVHPLAKDLLERFRDSFPEKAKKFVEGLNSSIVG